MLKPYPLLTPSTSRSQGPGEKNLIKHYHQVRSTTLDVKVWELTVLDMFDSLGNTASNNIWEARLSDVTAAAAAAAATASGRVRGSSHPPLNPARVPDDSWVWCEESDDDDAHSSLIPPIQTASR
jgi:hypothetical protein